MKPIYTTIPVGLCEYALKNRKVNEVKVYIYLKHISSGHVRFNTRLYEVWANDLGLTGKTVKKSIEWLIKNKWITVNSRRSSLRIIGYKQLFGKLRLQSRWGAKFECEDFTTFKGFCCGAVITYYMMRKYFSDRKNKWPGLQMTGSSKSQKKGLKHSYTLPIRYLASCMGVSISTANNFKLCALKNAFIITQRQVNYLSDDNGSKISSDMMYCYGHANETMYGRLRRGRKYLKVVDADLISSAIHMTRKSVK